MAHYAQTEHANEIQRGEHRPQSKTNHTQFTDFWHIFNRARTWRPSPAHTKQTATHAHCKQKDMYKPTHFVLLALGPGSSLCCLVLCCVELFSCKHTWNEHVFTYYCSKQSQIQPPPTIPGGPLVQRPCWTWARTSFSAWNTAWYRGPGSDLPLATANENAALLRDSER